MNRGVYVGDTKVLKGKTALLRKGEDGLFAQFDDRDLPKQYQHLTYHWHLFDPSEFEVQHV